MIIIYHKKNKVVEVKGNNENIFFSSTNIAKTLFELGGLFPDKLIVWCHYDLKSSLNVAEFPAIFHHNKIMASYNPFNKSFISNAIGYVEDSPFIKINKKVNYPTWQISSYAGGIQGGILLALKFQISTRTSFDYFLHSLAKLAMPIGLLCYSEPKILKDVLIAETKKNSDNFILFRFIKQHYKTRWIFLLFINLFLYERKTAFLPVVFSLFYSRRKLKNDFLLEEIPVQSKNKVIDSGTIDVILPTIGRKQYLYDVLKDLSRQTYLPVNVIIVEQNPTPNTVTELDYINDEVWPFAIKHIFTHQAGAVNARNMALAEVKSEWVFLNDDDNRFEAHLLEKTIINIQNYGAKAVSTSYLQYNEIKTDLVVNQSSIFGSGNSFILSNLLEKVEFNKMFAFGYGEDSDFGMQLRNVGIDIIYFPKPEILHLKAPMGGFRTKPVLEWQKDFIQPKPSPTIMLYKILHQSTEQINGYKTILFLKFYKVQSIKNPFLYFFSFKKQWKQSDYWANQLKNKP
ncbi:glycosyl transferase [Flavobacterium piscis]|uniref:Glycosyl transferase n=1 Tax=Flavobacterium piscis TaxID=1114874 RepID=A0ABX2XEW4_9FLAO|nr:glycosyltransferase family A protein [Flavobacterium piscis]OCB70602.1 glycosyl transferase [Flavobacterium piscis]OXG03728.1 glycosyl transferase [Flavobacterium piscis]